MKATTRLRRMLKGKRLVVAPFCYDAFQAKIAEAVGFRCIYMTGFGTAAARGYPDVGLLTQTEMVENARSICRAVSLPVICDADTGYGNPINVIRTVREYEAAGAAGIHIEDQVFPKKCGFFAGKQVIPLEEHVQKIRAALDARRDPDFLIVARTDALAVHGWEETLRRARAYFEAGADMVFVDGVKTVEDLEVYARELPEVPKLYNGALRPVKEIERMGFKVMITGGTIGVVYLAVKRAFQRLKRRGTVPEHDIEVVHTEVPALLGLPRIYEWEDRYKVREPLARR